MRSHATRSHATRLCRRITFSSFVFYARVRAFPAQERPAAFEIGRRADNKSLLYTLQRQQKSLRNVVKLRPLRLLVNRR